MKLNFVMMMLFALVASPLVSNALPRGSVYSKDLVIHLDHMPVRSRRAPDHIMSGVAVEDADYGLSIVVIDRLRIHKNTGRVTVTVGYAVNGAEGGVQGSGEHSFQFESLRDYNKSVFTNGEGLNLPLSQADINRLYTHDGRIRSLISIKSENLISKLMSEVQNENNVTLNLEQWESFSAHSWSVTGFSMGDRGGLTVHGKVEIVSSDVGGLTGIKQVNVEVPSLRDYSSVLRADNPELPVLTASDFDPNELEFDVDHRGRYSLKAREFGCGGSLGY